MLSWPNSRTEQHLEHGRHKDLEDIMGNACISTSPFKSDQQDETKQKCSQVLVFRSTGVAVKVPATAMVMMTDDLSLQHRIKAAYYDALHPTSNTGTFSPFVACDIVLWEIAFLVRCFSLRQFFFLKISISPKCKVFESLAS